MLVDGGKKQDHNQVLRHEVKKTSNANKDHITPEYENTACLIILGTSHPVIWCNIPEEQGHHTQIADILFTQHCTKLSAVSDNSFLKKKKKSVDIILKSPEFTKV